MKKKPIIDHLNELRKRLLICTLFICISTAICFNIYPLISTIFTTPFHAMLPGDATLNIMSIYEGFFVKLKLSIICGIIMALPFLLFQLCRFICPGLKKNEIKWVMIALVFSSFFSIVSTYIGYAIIFPYIIKFLTTSTFVPNNIQLVLNFGQNISYIISFLFAGVIIFQSPLILLFLLAKNMITRSFLIKNFRWFVIAIMVICAIITPPDIISQLSLSIPLTLCYLGCIAFAKLMKWGTS